MVGTRLLNNSRPKRGRVEGRSFCRRYEGDGGCYHNNTIQPSIDCTPEVPHLPGRQATPLLQPSVSVGISIRPAAREQELQ